MNKILLIIKREYLARVRKKTFIIGTILFPVLYLLLIIGTPYIADKSRQDLKVAVIDRSGYFTEERITNANSTDTINRLVLINETEDEFKTKYDSLGYNGYIVIPQNANWKERLDSLLLNTNKTFGIGATAPVENKLNRIWSEIKNDSLGIDSSKKLILATSNISLKLNNSKNQAADAGIATVIGYVCGFLMYLILLLYGSQVMMGVTEEKTSRIAEVIVSSVKPFQLMMGKIIGIGAVGLTQFAIWIILMFLMQLAIPLIFPEVMHQVQTTATAGGDDSMVTNLVQGLSSLPLLKIVSLFLFYFLAGYLTYASLFAAVGSVVSEDQQEAQQLIFPILMPIILGFVIMTNAINNPHSNMAIFGSLFPLTSPIVMMGRVTYDIPFWQIAVSMLLLAVCFLFFTWVTAKIYRTGILMYGKKPSWKEMIKWGFRKS